MSKLTKDGGEAGSPSHRHRGRPKKFTEPFWLLWILRGLQQQLNSFTLPLNSFKALQLLLLQKSTKQQTTTNPPLPLPSPTTTEHFKFPSILPSQYKTQTPVVEMDFLEEIGWNRKDAIKWARKLTALSLVFGSFYVVYLTGAMFVNASAWIFVDAVVAFKFPLLCILAFSVVAFMFGLVLFRYAFYLNPSANIDARSYLFRPTFFCSFTEHRRFSSGFLNYFKWPIFYVAVPGNFQGSIGRLFSVKTVGGNGVGDRLTFFSLDPKRYVRPDLPFELKFWGALKEANLNPAKFSDMLIVTTPCFLGYAFNPVSYFLFYTPTGKLGATIFEVRNTFGEKDLYVLSPQHAKATKIRVRKGYTFSDRCRKKFHISPFNHRSGHYDFHMLDPVADKALDFLMIVFDYMGKKTMTCRAKSHGKGIDMLSISGARARSIVANWGPSQAMAIPRTFYEAFKIFRRKKCTVYQRPETILTSSARAETYLESVARIKWLAYFRIMVLYSRTAITVTVNLPRTDPAVPSKTYTFVSESYDFKHDKCIDPTCAVCVKRNVTLNIRSPAFFRRMMAYDHPRVGYMADVGSKKPEFQTATVNEPEGWKIILFVLGNPYNYRIGEPPSKEPYTLFNGARLLTYWCTRGSTLIWMRGIVGITRKILGLKTGFDTGRSPFKPTALGMFFGWEEGFAVMMAGIVFQELCREIWEFVIHEMQGMTGFDLGFLL